MRTKRIAPEHARGRHLRQHLARPAGRNASSYKVVGKLDEYKRPPTGTLSLLTFGWSSDSQIRTVFDGLTIHDEPSEAHHAAFDCLITGVRWICQKGSAALPAIGWRRLVVDPADGRTQELSSRRSAI